MPRMSDLADDPVVSDDTLRCAPGAVPPQDGSACLVTVYPADASADRIKMAGDCVIVGRDRSCDLVLTDYSISRRHAVLTRHVDGWRIADLNSTNGTFVNDRPTKTCLLKSGDRVRLGNFVLKFLMSADVEADYQKTIQKMAVTDGMTATFNQSYLLDHLDRVISAGAGGVAVMRVDLDRFKSINDRFGNLAGDIVLQEFARRARDVLTSHRQLLARDGGQRFTVVVEESSLEEALSVAEQLRAAAAGSPVPVSRLDIDFTISIGVAHRDDCRGLTAQQLVELADQNLCHAKQAGRNRVVG